MKEKTIVNNISTYLKTIPECFFWKEHGGMYGTAGIPDIIACVKGRFFGFEVKNETGQPIKVAKSGHTFQNIEWDKSVLDLLFSEDEFARVTKIKHDIQAIMN